MNSEINETLPIKAVSLTVIEQQKEQKEKKVEVKKTQVKKESFVILEDSNDIFNSRIQINGNDIKHFLIINDSTVISGRQIFDGLSGQELERANASCRFNILGLIQDAKTNEYFDNDEGGEVKKYLATLKKFNTKFETLFSTIKHSDSVKFNMLPFFIQKDMLLATNKNTSIWVGMRVMEAKLRSDWFGTFFEIKGRIIHFNGKSFREARVTFKVPEFTGERKFSELGIKFQEQDQQISDSLIERGKKYEKLHANGPSYMKNTGTIVRQTWFGPQSFIATGRVMVDRAGMTNIDPNYDKYFGYDRYNDEENKNDDNGSFNWTDDKYFITSPYCYGFSFAAKQWGELLIDQLDEINFRDDAFQKLVLNEETKEILFSLTETSKIDNGKDVVDGKGGGCIFLLHGTPGIGKTLTAETISETLKRPLYMVSVGELGTTVNALEDNLRNILQVSASWNAVLLLDECDIYLEQRDLDIQRNALVGVFLRLLEYYNGILFLTTNRVNQIDKAFYSRISLAIKYPTLSNDARNQIWSNQMKLYDMKLNETDVKHLSDTFDLNGRQIKNCVRIINSLAVCNKITPVLADYLKVVNKVEEFNKTLASED